MNEFPYKDNKVYLPTTTYIESSDKHASIMMPTV